MPLLLGVSLLVAAGVTLGKVGVDQQGRLGSAGGYTWSLSLWFLPIAVLLVWFIRRRDQVIQRPAFWTTLIVLIGAGFALDYFFAHSFFLFPNAAATLLPPAPARGGPVPSEEYLFYVGGFLFVLLLYIWCDEDFLLLYNVPDYREAWAKTGRARVAEFDPFSLTGAVVLIAAAWIYKVALAQGPYRGGFPGVSRLSDDSGSRSRRRISEGHEAVHQLAGVRIDVPSRGGGFPALGSDSGGAPEMVGLSARQDDRHRGRSVARPSARSRAPGSR